VCARHVRHGFDFGALCRKEEYVPAALPAAPRVGVWRPYRGCACARTHTHTHTHTHKHTRQNTHAKPRAQAGGARCAGAHPEPVPTMAWPSAVKARACAGVGDLVTLRYAPVV